MTKGNQLVLRKNYQLPGPQGLLKIPLKHLSVSPENRSGLFPSPARVIWLLCKILLGGFNPAEANHEGVVVQELPEEMRTSFKEKYGIDYLTFRKYNLAKVASVSALRVAFNEDSTFEYATLSHSTLVVGLLCLMHGAVWPIPAEFKGKGLEKLQNAVGQWDVDALMKFNKDVADIFKDGITFQVLHWRIFLEQPRGTCAKISHGINEAQSLAMNTHEMEAMNATMEVIEEERARSAVAGQLGEPDYDETKAILQDKGLKHAEDPFFQDMFTYIIELGSKQGGLIDGLLEYDRRFVDHNLRTLSLQAFAVPNSLPDGCPRCKKGLIMRAYHKDPVKGQCPLPEPTWGKFKPENLQSLEDILFYFDKTLGPAVAGLEEEKAEELRANVYLQATESFIRNHRPGDKSVAKVRKQILEDTKEFYDTLLEKTRQSSGNPRATLRPPKAEWIDFSNAEGGTKAEAEPKADVIKPVVLVFDPETGAPINQQVQDESGTMKKGQKKILEVPVTAWRKSAQAAALDLELWHQSLVAVVMVQHHHCDSSTNKPLQLLHDITKDSYCVVASADIEEQELNLFPCCPRHTKFPKLCTNREAQPVFVKCLRPEPEADNKAFQYWLVPDWKPPTCKATAVAEDGSTTLAGKAVFGTAEHRVEMESYSFHFTGNESIHYYWGIERFTAEELTKKRLEKGCEHWEFNLAVVYKDYKNVSAGGVCGVESRCGMVSVPLITNTRRIVKGDRLFLEVKPKKVTQRPSTLPAWQVQRKRREEENEKDKKRPRLDKKGSKRKLSVSSCNVEGVETL